ncbi:ATP synthase protein I-like membrane protein [hydrothermal vent metagenome]|uniref:ATP synthase protein I-like membrane protein n=1 Tax=hydrothermal vent metagenome TaxID=652676 RepID=A0A1W1EI88_9ZZZZ
MENKNEPKFKKIADGANDLSLGISMVVAVLLGVGLGILMRDLFDTPWLFWLGVFWGVAGAFLNVYKAYEKQKKSLEELADDPKYQNYKPKDDED